MGQINHPLFVSVRLRERSTFVCEKNKKQKRKREKEKKIKRKIKKSHRKTKKYYSILNLSTMYNVSQRMFT